MSVKPNIGDTVWIPVKVMGNDGERTVATAWDGTSVVMPNTGKMVSKDERVYFCPGHNPPWSTDPLCGN